MRIAVVGGGIGGLVTAVALKEAGFGARVFEQAEQFTEVGAGLSLGPNAVKGLESIGFKDVLAASANEPLENFLMHGLTGEQLVRIDRRDTRERYGAALYQMHRADFLETALGRLSDDSYETGKRLVDLSQTDNGVVLKFADGSEYTSDVVIAADGLRSVARDILFDADPPVHSGHYALRALIPADRLDDRYTGRSTINHVGPERLFLTYPVRGGELINIVALVRSKELVEESWNVLADPAELAARFEGWADYVTDAIAALKPGELARWGLYMRQPLDSWCDRRVTLLGDAAHPMLPYLGLGASCALEDAVVIARCFAAESDPEAALKLFEKTRLKRAAFVQRESNKRSDAFHSPDPYILRNNPPPDVDSLGLFHYDPSTVALGEAIEV